MPYPRRPGENLPYPDYPPSYITGTETSRFPREMSEEERIRQIRKIAGVPEKPSDTTLEEDLAKIRELQKQPKVTRRLSGESAEQLHQTPRVRDAYQHWKDTGEYQGRWYVTEDGTGMEHEVHKSDDSDTLRGRRAPLTPSQLKGPPRPENVTEEEWDQLCLLYTSDAADE